MRILVALSLFLATPDFAAAQARPVPAPPPRSHAFSRYVVVGSGVIGGLAGAAVAGWRAVTF